MVEMMSADLGPLGDQLGLTISHTEPDLVRRFRKASLLDLPEMLKVEASAAKGKKAELQFARFRKTARARDPSCESPIAISAIKVAHRRGFPTAGFAAGTLAEYNIAGLVIAPGLREAEDNVWWMFAPLSEEHPPRAQAALLDRLDNLFWGAIAGEESTASSAVDLGMLGGLADPRAWFADGRYLDRCHDLDAPVRYRAGGYSEAGDTEAELDDTSLVHEAKNRILAATAGERQETLLRESYALGRLAALGILSVRDVVDILIEPAAESGLCGDYGGYQVRRTIRTAALAGRKHRTPPL